MVDIKKPIRILHVLPGLTYCGGIEAYLLNYYRHIDRSKIQFDFITHSRVEHEIKSEIESLGGRVFDWETFRISRFFARRIVKLSATPLRNRPHMVFCSQGTFWGAGSTHGISVGCNPLVYP